MERHLTVDTSSLKRYGDARVEALAAVGIELVVHQDFRVMHALNLPEKSYSQLFSPDLFELTPENALWIEGRHKGETVHVQAVRLQDATTTSLGAIWDREFSRIFPENSANDDVLAEEGDVMQGRIAYHGELWLRNDFRGVGLGAVCVAYCMALAHDRFSPDWHYGFVAGTVSQTGFPLREGFLHTAPLGDGWRKARPLLHPTDYIVSSSRRDFQRVVERDAFFEVEGPHAGGPNYRVAI